MASSTASVNSTPLAIRTLFSTESARPSPIKASARTIAAETASHPVSDRQALRSSTLMRDGTAAPSRISAKLRGRRRSVSRIGTNQILNEARRFLRMHLRPGSRTIARIRWRRHRPVVLHRRQATENTRAYHYWPDHVPKVHNGASDDNANQKNGRQP